MNKMFNGMFGEIQPGMCRISMDGGIAVKTSNGDYKSYDMKTKKLINCDSFVFDVGEEFFFVIPTNNARKGDILLISGKPKYVIKAEKDMLTVINYEDSTVETVLPERHMFMGNTYFYGKIVSMFGNDFGKSGASNIMKYMMMSKMMKGSGDGNNTMLALMMMNNNFGSIFDNLFNFSDEENDNSVSEESEEK